MSHNKETAIASRNSDLSTMEHVTAAPRRKESISARLVAWWEWARFPVMLFLCTRLALLAFSYVGLTLVPELWDDHGPRNVFQNTAFEGLCRWDCYWFVWIAEQGYWEARATNFFPLYPAFVRMVYEVTGLSLHAAALVVSNAAGFGALLAVYRVFTMLADEAAARWALMVHAAFPFSFFQATGYPESLMMLYSALAILFALRGNHIWAGVMLGFGVLARHVTMIAGAALLAAQIRERGLHPKRFLLSPAILGLFIPWLFLGAYSIYQYIQFGSPLAFWHARSEPPWGELAWWGVVEVLTTPDAGQHGAHVRAMQMYMPFALLPTLGALALASRKQWAELAAFAIILIGVVWLIGIWGLGRYAASCWPAFLPFGVLLSKRPAFGVPVIGILAAFQGLFFFLFMHQFPIL